MVDLKDIHPLTAFKRNTTAYMKQLKQSRNPLVLTVNGKAEMVVLDAESYQDILDRIEYVETVKALKEGMESIARGEGRPAREALEELRRKYDIPG